MQISGRHPGHMALATSSIKRCIDSGRMYRPVLAICISLGIFNQGVRRMTTNTWPRNLYSGVGGGMYKGVGGGMYAGAGGGAYTGVGGGMYKGVGGGMYTGVGGGLYTGVGGGLYTGVGGGLYTGVGGGLYTGVGGGLYSGVGGGMYKEADSNPYSSNIPPWPVFLREVEARGFHAEGKIIRAYLPEALWPENFFR